MDGEQRVWAPHPVEGYQLGLIVDVGADTLTVQPLASSEQVTNSIVISITWPITVNNSVEARGCSLGLKLADFCSWKALRGM